MPERKNYSGSASLVWPGAVIRAKIKDPGKPRVFGWRSELEGPLQETIRLPPLSETEVGQVAIANGDVGIGHQHTINDRQQASE
jgi:hypothetical protein